MKISRRRFVQVGGAAAAALATPGGLAARPDVGWRARAAADMPAPDLAALLLSRAAFGARPGEVEAARAQGAAAWIEAQLHPETLPDPDVDAALAGLPTLRKSVTELLATYPDDNGGPAVDELVSATLTRALFSRRQLLEVMVDFWSDHFSVYHRQDLIKVFKTIDDRDVIRKHALGSFRDLLTASAHSPCMLHFLDNDENRAGRPNENYAREIMELHSLGVAVDGDPYTEEDVLELARCLTGWTWQRDRTNPAYGTYVFTARMHDDNAKEVLGQYFPARQGERDGDRAIEMLLAHEATGPFLATKLVRRFVTDDPAAVPGLVARVADAYRQTDGDIRVMVRTVLTSPEFATSFGDYGGKLVRPLDLVARMLRAAGADPASLRPGSQNFRRLSQAVLGRNGYLAAMGQIPFAWATPDGYPDTKESWAASAGILARWNMGLDLVDGALVPGFRPHASRPQDLASAEAVVGYWVAALLHREILPEDRATLVDYLTEGGQLGFAYAVRANEPYLVALILDSPYFHWR